MPTYKVVVFFNQFTQGWTETYYTSNLMTTKSFQDPNWINFFNSSIAFRGHGTYIYGARWTQEGSVRVNYSQLFQNYDSPFGSYPSEEPASLDWVVKVLTNSGYSRHIYLRGINALWVQRNSDGISIPNPNLLSAFTLYLQAMVNLQLQVKVVQNPILNPGLPVQQVLSVSPNALNVERSDLLMSGALGLAVTPPVFVRFLKTPRNDLPGFPAKAQILNVFGAGSTSISIPYRYRGNGLNVNPQSMQVVQALYTPETIINSNGSAPAWQTISFNERKTGRAFGVPRGRSRTVVSRR